ncbi:MAG: hypothetical protein ABIH03_06335, partial [Pseudomonadota bacterium]
LPIWMNYIGKALNGVDEAFRQTPEGIASVNVDSETGRAASDGKITEYFYRENIPAAQKQDAPDGGARSPEEVKGQLF